ncbi:hypothetical protein [Streptomyces sp. MMS20-AI2-20]|uniref:hypothetical protein n=1 Tax=Streptomyces TaxID=1883 RepID=UPI001F621662|nr:hypothetical protein [Streptomyces sp. MMS20-AI2-20]MCI4143049.1 hypothetical protein [Streptomyces sp. MMS20-AI2-20]
MPDLTFSLSRYDGPATVNGVPFAEVHLIEHAHTEGDGLLKSWEGTAEVARREAPGVSPDWALDVVQVQLPGGGEGTAYVHNMTLTDGRYWKLDLSGRGPSPMA